MGPHIKSRKRLEKYFEEEDKSKPLWISSALQSISLNSKKKSQLGSPASSFYDTYCEIAASPLECDGIVVYAGADAVGILLMDTVKLWDVCL